jgi:hypothetical protein
MYLIRVDNVKVVERGGESVEVGGGTRAVCRIEIEVVLLVQKPPFADNLLL